MTLYLCDPTRAPDCKKSNCRMLWGQKASCYMTDRLEQAMVCSNGDPVLVLEVPRGPKEENST